LLLQIRLLSMNRIQCLLQLFEIILICVSSGFNSIDFIAFVVGHSQGFYYIIRADYAPQPESVRITGMVERPGT
jgi:hypothetical protein